MPVAQGFAALVAPARLVDSRPGQLGVLELPGGSLGTDLSVRLEPNVPRRFVVTGVAGVPSEVAGLALNVTAVSPSAQGFFKVYPCAATSSPQPSTSTVNFSAGVNQANGAIAAVDASGGLCVVSSQSAHLILDISGYFTAISTFTPLVAPARLVDSRPGQLGVLELPGGSLGTDLSVRLEPNVPRRFVVTGVAGVPSEVAGLALNVTAVSPSAQGFFKVYPCAATSSPQPSTSTVNFSAGVNQANGAIAAVDASGGLCVVSSQSAHLILDISGYFTAGLVAEQHPLATYGYGTCAIRSDQTISCWGSIGDEPVPSGQFVSITAEGDGHACALRVDLTIACWGSNDFGESSPPAGSFLSIAAGGLVSSQEDPSGFTCAVNVSYEVECWGDDGSGQTTAPVGEFTKVSAGAYHACAIAQADQTLECWGANFWGQSNPTPTGEFVDVAAGGFHSCGVLADGSITCWGSTDGTPPLGVFTAIAAGRDHTCALRADQAVLCWGRNHVGQSTAPSGEFMAISLNADRSCGMRTDGTVTCWGWLADSWPQPTVAAEVSVGSHWAGWTVCTTVSSGVATCKGFGAANIAPPPGNYSSVSAGSVHACGINVDDDSVVCWGSNDDYAGDFQFQAVPPAGEFTQLASGAYHSCAVRTDQTLACWGSIGVTVPAGTFTRVAAGDYGACGIRSNSTLTCWGSAPAGEPAGTYTKVALGESHACAVSTAESITCWGDNTLGQSSAPSGTFIDVAVGSDRTCGLRADNAVICWGQSDVSPNGTFLSLSGAESQMCGIRTDHVLQCWGRETTVGLPLVRVAL
jgi:alpha-tubulin suppressor-like RCC1 family protein